MSDALDAAVGALEQPLIERGFIPPSDVDKSVGRHLSDRQWASAVVCAYLDALDAFDVQERADAVDWGLPTVVRVIAAIRPAPAVTGGTDE